MIEEGASPEPRRSPARGYEPALDGLRAVCLLAVLFFHAGFSWMSGGFLGVSTFFTLSGFLVTELLLRDVDALGRVDLAGFWRRRLRRLAPASLAVIAVLALVAPPLVDVADRARLATDLLAALAQLSNWRFLGGDYAYSLLFSQPSLVQHFWSLAIEAQFYVAFPLVMTILVRRGGSRMGLALFAGAWMAAAFAASFVLGADPERWDRIYYGSDLRLPELLAGVLLALISRARGGGDVRDGVWSVAGALAMVLAIVAWIVVDLDTEWLHRGGFVAYALLSALWVRACVAGRGGVHGLLSLPPLVWMGRVSYGAYLIHWPIYVALDAGWPGLSPLGRLAICAPITFALAGASYALIEEPIRRGRTFAGRHAGLSAGAAAFVLAVAIFVPASPSEIASELKGAAAPASITRTDTGTEGALHLALFGDSSALSLAWGFARWSNESAPDVVIDSGFLQLGCGLLGPAWVEDLRRRGEDAEAWITPRGPFHGVPRKCLTQREETIAYLGESPTDIAVVLFGEWDVAGVRDPSNRAFRMLGEPELDAVMGRAIDEFVDALRTHGARVVWLTTPPLEKPLRFSHTDDEWEAARLRMNELLRETAAARPGDFTVVDLDARLTAFESTWRGEPLRHDGIHFTEEGGRVISSAGLGDAVLRAAEALAGVRDAGSDAAETR